MTVAQGCECTLLYTFKMVKMVNFLLCIFSTLKKKGKKEFIVFTIRYRNLFAQKQQHHS